MAKAAKKSSKRRTAAHQVSKEKRSVGKKQVRSQQSREPARKTESWLSAASTLVASEVGRAILAEVLEAAASALRKDRGRDWDEPRSESASSVGDVAAEGASRVFARTAAGVLAEVATGAVRRMLPEATKGDDEGRDTGEH